MAVENATGGRGGKAARQLALGADFLRRLEALTIAAGRKFAAGCPAARAGAVRGGRVEFLDHRPYAQGDDLRDLDWPLYGRTDGLFIKIYGAERAKQVTIILDLSASMAVSAEKEIFACRLAAALAHVALAAGDEVVMIPGAASSGAACAALPPRRGLRASRDIVAWLEGMPLSPAVDWTALARHRHLTAHRPGALLVISDFWTDGAIEALAPLARGRQEVALMRVLSAEELSPSCQGNVRLVDAESGEEISLRLTPRDIDVYRRAVQNHARNLAERAARNGMRHILCRPELPFAQTVLIALRRSRILR